MNAGLDTAPLRIIVAGAGGRMGRAILKEAIGDPSLTVAGAVDRPEADDFGRDAGVLAGGEPIGVAVTGDLTALLSTADVVIDFSSAEAATRAARHAGETGRALVIGATGFTADQEDAIGAAAHRAPIVKSGNMSLGVNILAALVEDAARRLGPAYDIEIVEAHHRAKTDAPSGTALMLGDAAARGRAVDLKDAGVFTREGQTGPRPDGAIGFAVIRGGGIIGDHDAHFASRSEVLTLSHRAIDRSLFAQGAIAAAKWAGTPGREAGLYSMRDVLEL